MPGRPPRPRAGRASTWQQRYLDRFYNPADGWVNGTAEFHALCRATIPPGSRILEVGAGESNPTSTFLATLGEVHGLDPDPDVAHNTALGSATRLVGSHFPFGDASFDVCVSNYVLEHVDDPWTHLGEVVRVLEPGGAYVFRTPNRFHYVALAGGVLPHRAHELLANRLRNLPPETHGPHRTVYAMNSRRAITRLAQQAGLRVEQLRLVEKEPSYGMASPALFLAFTAYERLVNATESLAFLRSTIIGVLRKPQTPGW
ncbi:MAG: methyltransferase domain-containing protein [Chloroflexi bacterium]|nr:methyltransferase domain-containing protein [Chloroflexota bacterium]